jgi:hypothetical protein
MLGVAVLPLFVIMLLPEWLGRKELFPNLPGKTGVIPPAFGLLWMFTFIVVAKLGWKKVGLRCSSCGHAFVGDASFEVVIATGRCGGCGKQAVQDSGGVTPNNSLQRR